MTSVITTLLLLLLLPLAARVSGDYTFAVVPKRLNSPYWAVVKTGCETRAKRLSIEMEMNITCLFTGPAEGGPETEFNQLLILEDLLASGIIDGLALAVVEADSATDMIQKFVSQDIPTVTFDSDAVESERLAYIGTNNQAMGEELGRVLLQINEQGGKYAIIGAGSPNIALRVEGVQLALNQTVNWIEVEDYKDCMGDPTLAVQQMHELMEAHPDLGAIIPVAAWPMFDDEAWRDFVDTYPNVVTVVGDSLQQQVDIMNMGYANALVGQLPFEMGKIAIDKLLEAKLAYPAVPFPVGKFFETSFLDIINIPRDLPPLVEDMHYIGKWSIFGYLLCGIAVALSVSFAVWTLWNIDDRVVKASQPLFLIMTCLGTLVMASAIIPLSIDDENFTQQGCNIACMASPWLFSIGFVVTFSALFSKTWRVNQVFHNPSGFRRIRVTESDVLTPFAILLTANVIVLLCWTFLAPLEFHRQPHSGTDHWNRVYKSFYGSCRSNNGDAMVYGVLLGLIDVCALFIANFQAYQARHIHVEFSESQYIGMAMVCMLQVFLVGAPVLLLMQESPVSTYIVQSILIFFTASSILLFIFVPKVLRKSDLNKSPLHNSSTSFQTSDTAGSEIAAGAKFKLMEVGAPQLTAIRESVIFDL